MNGQNETDSNQVEFYLFTVIVMQFCPYFLPPTQGTPHEMSSAYSVHLKWHA
jgi:hypothetical protein